MVILPVAEVEDLSLRMVQQRKQPVVLVEVVQVQKAVLEKQELTQLHLQEVVVAVQALLALHQVVQELLELVAVGL
jgi:hypothetical protein